MQRARLKGLEASDFGLDALDAPALPRKGKGKDKLKTKGGETAADAFAALGGASAAATETAERIARDVSRLTPEEARELVNKDSPELLGLLADLQTRLGELQGHLTPLLERLKGTDQPTEQGLSLLQVKHRTPAPPLLPALRGRSRPGTRSSGRADKADAVLYVARCWRAAAVA